MSDDDERALGCLGVCAVGEFSTTDPELTRLRARVASALGAAVAARVREGQALGEIDRGLDVAEVAGFVQLAMTGLQVAARGGATAEAMSGLADFTVGRLRAR